MCRATGIENQYVNVFEMKIGNNIFSHNTYLRRKNRNVFLTAVSEEEKPSCATASELVAIINNFNGTSILLLPQLLVRATRL